MKPAYEELLEIVESQQKQIDRLEKEIDKLRKELRKYVNENTPSGSIPPYLKKLEETVEEYSSNDDDKSPPKENVRNARPKHIDRKERHRLENPTCPNPDCKGHARRKGTSTRKRIVIHLQLPTAETVEHESDIHQCNKCGKVFSAPVPNALPRTEFDIFTAVFLSYMSIRSIDSYVGFLLWTAKPPAK